MPGQTPHRAANLGNRSKYYVRWWDEDSRNRTTPSDCPQSDQLYVLTFPINGWRGH